MTFKYIIRKNTKYAKMRKVSLWYILLTFVSLVECKSLYIGMIQWNKFQ